LMLPIPAISYERRQELRDAAWGGVAVAWTVVLSVALLWLCVAVVVGSVELARWVGRVA
jgi:hypothetical protein